MSRLYNFNAGPSTLPVPVLEEAAAELVEFPEAGMSVLEMSHRAAEYEALHYSAMDLCRELLALPADYEVLLLGGGATLQFSMVPLNLLPEGRSCDFTVTGSWSQKACDDAEKVGGVNVLFDGAADNYTSLPAPSQVAPHADAAYLHLTSNETIGGVQWQAWPETGDVPLVCDMSSDLMSRPLPVEKFGVIYAGAQKNLGPAGVTLIILRNDLLSRCPDDLPAYLSYRVHAGKDSLYNTPPVFAIYLLGKVLHWIKAQGGLPAMQQRAVQRSELLYRAIDQSEGFYRCPVAGDARSAMNVVWRLAAEELEEQFLAESAAAGMVGLKGHRSVGGCRASLYNAMPLEGAQVLAQFMLDFAARNG